MTRFRRTSDQSRRRDSLVAAAITCAAAALLLLILFCCSMRQEEALTAPPAHPGLMAVEEEEFLEPELLDLGEEQSDAIDEAAPSLAGEPEKGDRVEPTPVVRGENPAPAPPKEKPVTQKAPSPVKATEPPATQKEERKALNPAAGKFTATNGDRSGKADGSASGGEGVGITGSARGRTFLGCDKPRTALRFKTVITVDVTVDAEGRVIAASARSGADAAIRRECERAARTARWSAKRGAGETRGTITFTITPR